MTELAKGLHEGINLDAGGQALFWKMFWNAGSVAHESRLNHAIFSIEFSEELSKLRIHGTLIALVLAIELV